MCVYVCLCVYVILYACIFVCVCWCGCVFICFSLGKFVVEVVDVVVGVAVCGMCMNGCVGSFLCPCVCICMCR